jgi:hypothetical protein
MVSAYRPRYRAGFVVLSDATAPYAFSSVGAGGALIDYLAPRLVVARDVLAELRRNEARCPGLRTFVDWADADEDRRIHDLTIAHAIEVADLLRLYQLPGEHPREHLGEVATVYAAIELQEAGERPLVCVDDQLGKKLCRSRGLDFADTPALLVEMACEGAVEDRLGQKIWQALFSERRALWSHFRQRVAEARASRA